MLPSGHQTGLLKRVDPETLAGDDISAIGPGITIRHGESVITLRILVSAVQEDVANTEARQLVLYEPFSR